VLMSFVDADREASPGATGHMSDDPLRPIPIGWKEYIGFPEWGIRRVKAKVDTGAKTTALDVVGCELESDGAGTVAVLTLALHRRKPTRRRVVRVPVVRSVRVRNTGGEPEWRLVVEALVRLGPVEKRIHLTVADRSRMVCPVILGRNALAGDFVVDVSRKYLLPK